MADLVVALLAEPAVVLAGHAGAVISPLGAALVVHPEYAGRTSAGAGDEVVGEVGLDLRLEMRGGADVAPNFQSLLRGEGDVDPVLIAGTQAYLESRSRGMTPSPHLTAAWEEFYDGCTPLIERGIAAYPMSEEDRRDCFQEVWKEILARLCRFRYDQNRGQLRTWLHALTRNKAVDVIRRRRRHPCESLADTVKESLPGRESDPAAESERHQTQVIVRSALGRLSSEVSPSSYQVLYLRWIEGRTVPEIAVALGLTPEQVHFRHHRVMRKFRRLMEGSYENTTSGLG